MYTIHTFLFLYNCYLMVLMVALVLFTLNKTCVPLSHFYLYLGLLTFNLSLLRSHHWMGGSRCYVSKCPRPTIHSDRTDLLFGLAKANPRLVIHFIIGHKHLKQMRRNWKLSNTSSTTVQPLLG